MAYMLGVCGRMYSGKSTLAATLMETGAWDIVRFASPLKDVCRAILILTGHSEDMATAMVNGSLKNVWSPAIGMSTRQLMQLIGSEFRVVLDTPTLWRDIALDKADRKMRRGRNIVIDDVRFALEIDRIRERGGMIWGVRRPGAKPSTPSVIDLEMTSLIRQVPVLSNYRSGEIRNVFFEAFGVIEGVWLRNDTVIPFDRARALFRDAFVTDYILPKMTSVPSASSSGDMPHSSEQDFPVSLFDRYLVNDGTLSDFKAQVNDLIAKLDLKSVSEGKSK